MLAIYFASQTTPQHSDTGLASLKQNMAYLPKDVSTPCTKTWQLNNRVT